VYLIDTDFEPDSKPEKTLLDAGYQVLASNKTSFREAVNTDTATFIALSA